ncbi:MAG: hypothetical protein RL211_2109 [Pseudomonadota bacterium]
MASGEATGVLVKSIDNALPLVEGYQESQFWIEIANSIKTDDYNALTRDTRPPSSPRPVSHRPGRRLHRNHHQRQHHPG